MGATIVNCGLAISFAGAITLIIVALKFDPVKMFRVRNEHLQVSTELFQKLANRLKWGLIVGVMMLGIGTLIQMTGNLLS